jgi:hypothetical protein
MAQITETTKKKIIDGLNELRKNFAGSDSKFAVSVGINKTIYSQIKNGKIDKKLSDANWISLARRAGVSLTDSPCLNLVSSPVFSFINAQLEACQKNGLSSIFCDNNDIGKTTAAQHYAKTHKNAVYIDCSQLKSKQKFIRSIAREFGLGHDGRYYDVYEDLCFYLKTIETPIVIMDEVADLPPDAFLEIKALWNATDRSCAYYLIGAESLEEKIKNGISRRKIGYSEIFSRFGKRYGSVVPAGKEERNDFLNRNAAMIISGNCPANVDKQKILRGIMGADNTPSLRRIYTEIKKQLNNN